VATRRKLVEEQMSRREAKRVDVHYLAALEELVDATLALTEGGMTSTAAARVETALREVQRFEARQDFYRNHEEIGERSLRRFEEAKDVKVQASSFYGGFDDAKFRAAHKKMKSAKKRRST